MESKQEKLTTGGLFLLVCVIALLIFVKLRSDGQAKPVEQLFPPETSTEKHDSGYFVQICGEVKHPGVYFFRNLVRVSEVVNRAGGLTENADLASINLAAKIKDEMSICVRPHKQLKPTAKIDPQAPISEDSPSEPAEIALNLPDGMLDINSATKEQLEKLPGIGAATADRIVAYRDSYGFISSIDEIENIPGIKKKTIEKCRNYFYIEN